MRRLAVLMATTITLWPFAPAWGQTVTIDLDGNSAQLLEQTFGIDNIQSLVEDELNAVYGLADIPTFLRLSANAQSMANKGLGVDYASNVEAEGWVFGFAVSAAADAGDASLDEIEALADGNTERAVPISAGAQIAVMVGYALNERVTLFASGLYYPLETNDLAGTFYNGGVHVQYNALRPRGNRDYLAWGGLDLTTGFQLSRMFLELDESFETSDELVDGLDLDTRSVGTLEIEQRALTIPLEATTNVTMLHFLTLYGGVALDFQFGDASMNFDLDTELTTADPQNGGLLDLGRARIRVEETRDPTLVMFRVLAGVQVNIWKLKLFGQLNFLTEDLSVGLAGGIRLVL